MNIREKSKRIKKKAWLETTNGREKDTNLYLLTQSEIIWSVGIGNVMIQ